MSRTRESLDEELKIVHRRIRKNANKGRELRDREKAIRAELRTLALPAEPGPSVKVVRFTKAFGSTRRYDYAAIRHADVRFWAVTGREGLKMATWPQVAEFIATNETTVPQVVAMTDAPTFSAVRRMVAEAARPSLPPYTLFGERA